VSSNGAEVDAYIADPLCGFSLTPDSMIYLLSNGTRLADLGALAAIRKELPLYILAGERAPMVSGIGNLDRLIERYRAAGLRPALVRYPQGRHEILNETNRTEVVQNLLNWLNQVIDHDAPHHAFHVGAPSAFPAQPAGGLLRTQRDRDGSRDRRGALQQERRFLGPDRQPLEALDAETPDAVPHTINSSAVIFNNPREFFHRCF